MSLEIILKYFIISSYTFQVSHKEIIYVASNECLFINFSTWIKTILVVGLKALKLELEALNIMLNTVRMQLMLIKMQVCTNTQSHKQRPQPVNFYNTP